MIDKKVFYNLKCDCCGQLIGEQYWDEEEGATAFIDECGWKATEDGKHYCMDCYHIDENDRIVIKDGHVYDGEGYPLSEVKEHAIGERFEIDHIIYEVRPAHSCQGCSLYIEDENECLDGKLRFGHCGSCHRTDGQDVKFVQVGEATD